MVVVSSDFLKSLPLPAADISDLVASLQTASPISIRINEHKAMAAETLESVSWCKNAIYLKSRPRFTSDPAFHAGGYYPQDASSMFLSHIISSLGLNQTPIRTLDLCAAPGGKSTLLRQCLHPHSWLVANDVIKNRVKLLEAALVKWGVPGYTITHSDPSCFSNLKGFFDLIVVDAPCSGEGLFRKHPDAVLQWSTQNVAHCAARQKRILSDIWPALKPGGILIYSTCTYNTIENEENLNFLEGRFHLRGLKIPLPENSGILETQTKGIPGYRFMPHRVRGEGQFMAAVQKLDGQEVEVRSSSRMYQKVSDSRIASISASSFKDLKSDVFVQHRNDIAHLDCLQQHVRVWLPGHPIGKHVRGVLKINHGYSQLATPPEKLPSTKLSLIEALQFLEKNDIRLENITREIKLVTYKGFALGLAKAMPGRLVSQYPGNWRVLNGKPEAYRQIVTALDRST